MTGTSDTIQPTCFRYGRSIYLTWDYVACAENGYTFQYVELPAESSVEDVLCTAIEAMGELSDDVYNSIMEVVNG